MIKQKTIHNSIKAKGVGLHCGKTIEITLHPADEDTGIIFRRTDLPGKPEIPALSCNVSSTVLCTTISLGMASVSTIEHLMSAFSGLGVDNCYVDINGPEVPIMDGSSWHFVFLIRSAGIKEQSKSRKYIRIIKPLSVEESDKKAEFSPYDGFKVGFEIKYDHPAFEKNPMTGSVDLSRESFVTEISRARTFGFKSDIDKLRSMSLALGGSLKNAVVVNDEGIENKDGLRFLDELVKHKILDSIGDLYLSGHPILGSFLGIKSGHSLNNKLLRKLTENNDSWEFCYQTEKHHN